MVDKRAFVVAGIAAIFALVLVVFLTQLIPQREAIQSIQISFGGIQQKSLEPTTATLGLDLNLFNPTATNVSLDHTVYDLYANGTRVVNGTIMGPNEIAPGQTVKISTDGNIVYLGSLEPLLSNEQSGSIAWEMKGISYFEMPIGGLIQVPFDVSIPTHYSSNPGISLNQESIVQTHPVSGKNKTSSIPTMTTRISLQPSILRVAQNKTAGLTGQLTDITGKGIANQKVYVKSETPLWLVPTLGIASTDSSGWFALNWTANQTNWNSNTADIYAAFEGSTRYASSQSNSIHLEVLVSSLKTKPLPTLHYQNNTSEIVHETSPVYQVGIGTYSDIPFNVPCQVTATGSFSTYADGDRNIIVTIFDQINHDKFQRNMPYTAEYYSGKVQSDNFTLDLQPGVYYLMLSNTYSIYPKTVTVHASYYCN